MTDKHIETDEEWTTRCKDYTISKDGKSAILTGHPSEHHGAPCIIHRVFVIRKGLIDSTAHASDERITEILLEEAEFARIRHKNIDEHIETDEEWTTRCKNYTISDDGTHAILAVSPFEFSDIPCIIHRSFGNHKVPESAERRDRYITQNRHTDKKCSITHKVPDVGVEYLVCDDNDCITIQNDAIRVAEQKRKDENDIYTPYPELRCADCGGWLYHSYVQI